MRHIANDRLLHLGIASAPATVAGAVRPVGDRKHERRARAAGVGLGPQTTVMSLDDRAADEQPDAHTATLRGVEGLEYRVLALHREPDAGIANGQPCPIAVLAVGFDQQLSRSI